MHVLRTRAPEGKRSLYNVMSKDIGAFRIFDMVDVLFELTLVVLAVNFGS